MAEEKESSWWSTVSSVGSKFGQAAAKAGSDWLDKEVAQEQEQAAEREVARFQNGPAAAWRQRNMVERDQNVGAQPRSPRAGTAAAGGGGYDAGGMMGGLGDTLASPLGIFLALGTVAGLYYMATNN